MANNVQYGNERTNSLETEFGIDPASGGFFHVDSKNFRHEDLKEMLDSNKDSLKLEAMKRIIGMIAKGRDASVLFPAVVKNVVSKNIEVKKLVYVYLERYAEEQQDLALLSISTFQRALKEPNQLIRAGALRVLSSIRVTVIAPIVMIAIRDAAQDMSPYVRKTAAHAIPKLYSLDMETKPELVAIIQKLLADKTVLVIGSAVMAFTKVCPEREDLIHLVYRKLCNLLVDVDEWGQVIILNTLTRYCRTQFTNPNILEKQESEKHSGDSGSDTSEKHQTGPTLDPDHRLLLRSARPLLQSRNAAVVVAVAQLYHHCAPASEGQLAAKALVRLLSSHTEIQCIVLDAIASMSHQRRGMFDYYLKHFFVRMSDPLRIKMLKLDVLTNLACDSNVSLILREMQAYLSCSDKDFAAATIQAIGRCACRLADIADSCLNGLVLLLSNGNEAIVAESVIVVKRLLQTKAADPKEIIRQMTRLLDSITVPNARAAILWLLGEHSTVVPLIAPDVLRKMAKSFMEETVIVKLQILNLAIKLYLTNRGQSEQLCLYVFNLARYDQDYDIRDRARLLKPFLIDGKLRTLSGRASEIFLTAKPAPQIQSHFKEREHLQLGSLSHFINQRAAGYEPLPSFPEVPPPGNVRDVDPEEQKHLQRKTEPYWKDAPRRSSGEEFAESGSSSSDISFESAPSKKEKKYSDGKSSSGTSSGSASSSLSSESSSSSSDTSSEDASEDDDNEEDEQEIVSPISSNTPRSVKNSKPSSGKISNVDLLIDLDEGGDSSTPILTPSTNFSSVPLADTIHKNTPQTVTPRYFPTVSSELLDKISGRGLQVTFKFSRSPHVFSPSMVNIVLLFTNTTNEDITNIHIDQKITPSIPIAKFTPIESLKAGLSIPAYVGIDFNDSLSGISFDIVSSLGTNTLTIKPAVGELLRPLAVPLQVFEKHQSKLKGMNEHSATVEMNNAKDIRQKVFMAANVDLVAAEQDKNVYRFIGETLKSRSLTLIQVTNIDGSLTIKVNCEKLVIGSMLLNELKQFLQ